MNELLEALTKDLELLEIKKTPKYLVLKLPADKVNDWNEIQILNKAEFKDLNLILYGDIHRAYFDGGNFELPMCSYNRPDKMQQYYEVAQRLLEIDGGVK